MGRLILVYLAFGEAPAGRRLPAFDKDTLECKFTTRLPRERQQAHLLPGVVEHDCTAHGHSGLVLHKGVERLLVVVAPLVEQRAGVE